VSAAPFFLSARIILLNLRDLRRSPVKRNYATIGAQET
jgi:hypothetical protein